MEHREEPTIQDEVRALQLVHTAHKILAEEEEKRKQGVTTIRTPCASAFLPGEMVYIEVGDEKYKAKVVSNTENSLAIRPLYWYELVWDWLKIRARLVSRLWINKSDPTP